MNEYWTDIINDFIASGLSQKEYACKNNLKPYTLGYYVRKYKTSFSGFIEATNNIKTDQTSSTIEITFNKMKITVFGQYDEELLLSVLRTVKKV
jgi:hypothetical protein